MPQFYHILSISATLPVVMPRYVFSSSWPDLVLAALLPSRKNVV